MHDEYLRQLRELEREAKEGIDKQVKLYEGIHAEVIRVEAIVGKSGEDTGEGNDGRIIIGPWVAAVAAIPALGWIKEHSQAVIAFGTGAATATVVTLAAVNTGRPGAPQSRPGTTPTVEAIPPRVGPSGTASLGPVPPTVTPLPGAPQPGPSGDHPSGPPAASVPPIAPGRPPVTVTVTQESPGPTVTCHILLPRLVTPGLLCGQLAD